MKKRFLLIILLLGSVSSFGQIGLSYGVAWSIDINPYLHKYNDFNYFKGTVNFSAGLNTQINLNPRIWIGTKVLYSTKNYILIWESTYFHPDDPVIAGKMEVDYKNYYLDVPLEVGYSLFNGNSYRFYGVLGFVNSFALAGRNEHSSANKSYESFLFSQKIGFGNEFQVEKFAIIVEPQFRFFLNQEHRQIGVKNPVHFGIEIKVLRKPR